LLIARLRHNRSFSFSFPVFVFISDNPHEKRGDLARVPPLFHSTFFESSSTRVRSCFVDVGAWWSSPNPPRVTPEPRQYGRLEDLSPWRCCEHGKFPRPEFLPPLNFVPTTSIFLLSHPKPRANVDDPSIPLVCFFVRLREGHLLLFFNPPRVGVARSLGT